MGFTCDPSSEEPPGAWRGQVPVHSYTLCFNLEAEQGANSLLNWQPPHIKPCFRFFLPVMQLFPPGEKKRKILTLRLQQHHAISNQVWFCHAYQTRPDWYPKVKFVMGPCRRDSPDASPRIGPVTFEIRFIFPQVIRPASAWRGLYKMASDASLQANRRSTSGMGYVTCACWRRVVCRTWRWDLRPFAFFLVPLCQPHVIPCFLQRTKAHHHIRLPLFALRLNLFLDLPAFGHSSSDVAQPHRLKGCPSCRPTGTQGCGPPPATRKPSPRRTRQRLQRKADAHLDSH